ncbi:putative L-cysteine desulfhydrase 1 [Iris pallida]|uniref:L-cysteine desulfhydrase 1 n=1 Tax=Iris pallida TaxID=29817 RepID=A0AAX6IL88_IRIPA|nr:putative L-cysteine desulfhydrase 1 [Iris pallida]
MDPHRENGQSDGPNPKKQKPSPPPPITDDEILAEFSHHDPSVARINNGSFGSCPSSVLSAQSDLQLRFLRQPDHFYFNSLQPSLLRSRSLIRRLVNADDVSEISLVDNATTAAAIVLQQIQWAFAENTFSKGDAVVMLHYAYGAVKKSIHAYVARAGGHVIEVPLPFPVHSEEQIVAEFRKALDLGAAGGRKVRLAVIDHITSMPSVVIPVKELTKICREKGVDQVFVDAAHAIGNVDVDVRDIGADFYTSNLHKWFFCPPSVAFLYSRKSPASSGLHHPVVSHEYGNGLAVESGWIGTRDYSAQMVVPAVLDFVARFEGGIEGIRTRNHEKVVEMGKMLAEAWGTCLGSPPEMCCSMVMVGLPGCLAIENEGDATKLRTHLRDEFKVEVPIYYNSLRTGCCGEERNGSSLVTSYARISHQVYNVENDYCRLRDAINKLVKSGFNCGMLSSA